MINQQPLTVVNRMFLTGYQPFWATFPKPKMNHCHWSLPSTLVKKDGGLPAAEHLPKGSHHFLELCLLFLVMLCYAMKPLALVRFCYAILHDCWYEALSIGERFCYVLLYNTLIYLCRRVRLCHIIPPHHPLLITYTRWGPLVITWFRFDIQQASYIYQN